MGTFKDVFKKSAKDLEREKADEEIRKTLELLQISLEEIKSGKSKKEREEVSISIQLLILHYLGFLHNLRSDINNNIKTAFLLSVLLNKSGDENIRKKLSNVGGKGSELLTIQNLTYIKNLFEQIGLTEPLEKVKNDLSKIPIKE